MQRKGKNEREKNIYIYLNVFKEMTTFLKNTYLMQTGNISYN